MSAAETGDVLTVDHLTDYGQSGFTGVANGTHTFAYNTTFDSLPVVVANVDISTSGEISWSVTDRTTTTFTIRIKLNGVDYAGGGGVQWIAIGART